MTADRSAATSAAATPGRQAKGLLDTGVFLRPIAHRGLHDRAKGRIENTAPAFQAAIDKGYGIECDLQAAEGGTPMVFHDERLERLVDATGRLDARSPAALARLRYKGQHTHILCFAEFLELVAGRAPLLVEVKKNRLPPPQVFIEQIARTARGYRGPIALMSFNREMVSAFATLAPRVPRGLVVGTHQLPAAWWAAPSPAARSAVVGKVLSAAPRDMSFFAVDVRMLRGAAATMSRSPVRLPLFSWTIRTDRERAAAARWADAPIFEGYEA